MHKKNAGLLLFGKYTFYLWRLLIHASTDQGLGLYEKLLDFLIGKDEKFGFISFNYDTLLDKTYQQKIGGVVLDSLENYIANNLIKPHGSINWFLQRRRTDPQFNLEERTRDWVTRLDRATSLMFSAGKLSINGTIVEDPGHPDFKNLDFIASRKFSEQYFYPLILLPLSSKLFEHFDGFKKTIIEGGKNMLREAADIFLIGYRAKDAIVKELFEDLNSDKPYSQRLHVVSLSSAEAIQSDVLSWKPNLQKGRTVNGGFENFLKIYPLTDWTKV